MSELTPETQNLIDGKSYESLLLGWRFHVSGSPMFQGETGEYWAKRINELRRQPGGDAIHVAASKSIGWD